MRFDGFRKLGPDTSVEDAIRDHCARFRLDALEGIKLFPVLARRQWLKRFLAHVELFKQTLDVPGDILELGVFRGAGLMTWANLLESYCIGDRTKIVYGFDNWEGFTALSKEDGGEDSSLEKVVGGFDASDSWDELNNALRIFDGDRFVPWKSRVQLVRGNIEATIPDFFSRNPGIRLSLVHFDCDLYAPTRIALETLWPRVSRGGILLFDEYAIKDWPGETQAVDEFIADKPDLRIHKFSWTNAPSGYIVKP